MQNLPFSRRAGFCFSWLQIALFLRATHAYQASTRACLSSKNLLPAASKRATSTTRISPIAGYSAGSGYAILTVAIMPSAPVGITLKLQANAPVAAEKSEHAVAPDGLIDVVKVKKQGCHAGLRPGIHEPGLHG